VVGRRSETPDGDHFWADELALQVLHGPGDPRVSRVETLSHYSHYSRHSDGSVGAEQWQASYPSPALGLAAAASSSNHYSLELTPVNRCAQADRCAQAKPEARVSPCRPPPQSDPAS
jgi:hypothetical protein